MRKTLKLTILAVALLAAVAPARAQGGARDAGYLYLSPVPGASYVSAQTRYVLVRFANVTPSEVTNLTTSFITVTAASSGPHSGVTHVASDGRTAIFEMSVDFSQNELVTVTLNPQLNLGASGTVAPYEYQFMVAALMPGTPPAAGLSSPVPVATRVPADEEDPVHGPRQDPEPAGNTALAVATIKPNGVSVPGDFPAVVITVNSNPSPGHLFLETGVGSVPKYTMILDNTGSPVWYRRGRMYDFKIQKNGQITCAVRDGLGFLAFDEDFNYIQTYSTANGYLTDDHELEVLEDGSYLMLGYRMQTVDMSHYFPGGSRAVRVRKDAIQEFTAAGELIFQWRAWDHYDIRDERGGTDFPHMNALDVDEDGHLLVSSRYLNEVTKINRDTGEIIWRLSGVRSSFTFVNDPLNGTSWQHDISALGNGRYLLFDNGNYHVPQVSRAVEYRLDLINMTAILIWEFRDTPDKFAYWMGNAQRLPTGNTLMNFVRAQYPKAIEVDSYGVKRFELSLVPSSDSYRAFRFPWNGAVAVPYLIIEPQTDNVTLIFNKFGDTNVAYYRIYGDTSPQPTTLLATSTTTLKRLTNLENGRRYYFRVTAVNGLGLESACSNEENVTVNIIKPGEQMVVNGDFSQGTSPWVWSVTGGASGQWRIADGVSCFDIANGGGAVSSLQLRQVGVPLVQGEKYVFEFDAWSQAQRYIEAKVAQAVSPYANYSGIGFSFLTPTPTHCRYVFTMQAASDFNCSVMFNLGTSVFDVFLDNVSLFNAPPGDFNMDRCVNYEDLAVLTGEWLKQKSGLTADINADGEVDFKDFAVFGETWSGAVACP